MATNTTFRNSLYRSLILFGFFAFGQAVALPPKPAPKPKPALAFSSEAHLRQAVFDSAARFIGKTEKSGRNDAAWITAINRFNNLPKNAHYCASAFYYVHAIAGVSLPVAGRGMVRSYFSKTQLIIYRRSPRGNQRMNRPIQRMDAVSLFYSHIEGIAQDRYDPEEDESVSCIGFNTSGGRGTKDGCYVNRRRTSEIKLIANWISPYVIANPGCIAPKI